jgi:hypothetical protein
MKLRSFLIVQFILSSTLFSGCLIAQENFSNAWPVIGFYTKSSIKVAVLDEREYVKSGKNVNSYVGLIRDLYGRPRKIFTANSTPLADDVEKAVSNGFENAGIDATVADTKSKADRRSSSANEKLLLIIISEWFSDTYKSVGFTYKLSAEVYGHDGKKLATSTVENSKTFLSALEGGRDALTELLSDKEIARTLSNKQSNIGSELSNTSLINNSSATDAEKTSGSDTKARLLKLKEIFDAGIISKSDYEKKKNEILGQL